MIIRQFKTSEASEVSELIKNSVLNRDNSEYNVKQINSLANHYSPQEIGSDFRNKSIYVCVINEKIVGTATLRIDEVMAVFVHPDYRMRGIGSSLMEVVEKKALENGIFRVWLVSGLSSVLFYKKRRYIVFSDKIHPEWGRGVIMEKVFQ
ncbi:MAG: GNAT family N-acetyltransferase [Nanoarchaeota archaeon]